MINMTSKSLLKLSFNVMVLGVGFFASTANAAITLDRTRAIFDGDQKSMTISIYNKNKDLPYLAQAWMENQDSEKINSPFIIVPPIQRVEPSQASQVRIEVLPSVAQLPQDRETVYYFNLREVPPKSDKPNVLQIALQSKIKFFYRPASLKRTSTEMINKPWQAELILQKQGNKVIVKNPTAYYTTIIGVNNSQDKAVEDFQGTMISPFGEKALPVDAAVLGNTPSLVYINDYGGKEPIKFLCQSSECKVKK